MRKYFFALPVGKVGIFVLSVMVLFLSPGLFAADKNYNSLPFPISFTTSDYNGFGVSCNGAADGSIDLTINGGVAPYDITWSTGAVSEDISGLIAGNYIVTVIDAVQDTTIDSVSITEPDIMAIAWASVTPVSCFGLSDGSIDITPSGGTGVYSFAWTGGTITEDLTGASAGNYSVTVTDNNNCSVTNDTLITEPDTIITNLVTQDANAAPDGEASVTPTGGTGSYSYLWSTGATSSLVTGLLPGTYTVTVTDANLCSVTESAIINNALGVCLIVTDSVFNVSCNGGSDGAIYISTFAAIDPITYQWSNGEVTQDITGLAAGTYTVTITDVILCTATQVFVITEPDILEISLTPQQETCNSDNGSITSVTNGGTGPFTYLWSTTATTPSINALNAGTYTVTVTDQNGCTDVAAAIVTAITPPQVVIDSVINVRCFGGATGAVYTTTTNGTLPYSVIWSNGSSSQDITGLGAGTYTITVTDQNSCTTTASGIVTQPLAALNDSVQTSSPTCGNSNGSITVFPYNGTGPYTYLWSNSQSTQTISGLAPGTFTVTITDANLCTRQRVVSILNIAGPVVVVDSIRNVRCFGGATGAVYITVTGGTLPLSYLWSNGSTAQDLVNVTQGNKIVTVTDANSCTSTVNAVVTQPLAALADSIQISRPTCGNSNGSVTIFSYNGTAPYTYQWSNLQTTSTISNLSPGTYTVTVTDANLCTRLRTAVLNNIAGPVAVLDSVRNVRCFGGLNGGVFITVTGGTAPRVYQWSNGAATVDIQNVVAGNYTMIVTDANSCTDTIMATVTQPAAISDSVQVSNSVCNAANGSITIFPFGGTPGYSYQWSNLQTTQAISNLNAGSYTVTVTDANLCTRVRVVTVANLANPVAVIDSVRNVKCFGGLTGGIFISVTGGTPPLSYLWSNGTITQDIQNVAAGTYTVTVTDANNCTATLDTIITQPAVLAVSNAVTNAACGQATGAITATPSGGTAPYGYVWNTGLTTPTITGLTAGNYTVTVTDANSCTRVQSSLVGTISGPTAVLDSIRNVRCNGAATGAIYIHLSGGTAPFSYSWSSGAGSQDLVNVVAGIYTVTVTDANNCTSSLSATITQPTVLNDSIQINNASCGTPSGSATVFAYGGTSPYTYLWNTGSVSSTIFNLNAGSYTVTITDAFGCTRQDVANISSLGGPVVTIDSIRNVKCNGALTGGIYLTVAGGTIPYTYQWSNGAVSQDLVNVAAGTYTVTITDDNSCVVIVSGTIAQPTLLNDSTVAVNSTCGLANGSITSYPYGGVGPYSYLWNNGQLTSSISNLAAGIYTVTVTDFNGCTVVRSDTVLSTNAPLVVLDSVINASCFGGITGAIYITATGGTGPLSYLWSNSAVTSDLVGYAAGTYTVTVTDQIMCTATLSATIGQPTEVLDSAQVTMEACNSENGAINLFPFGGTPPYTFEWSNGEITQNLSGLTAGPYAVTITDSLGCEEISVYVVNAVAGPQVALDSLHQVNCNNGSDGGIFISITGGTPPFNYAWSNSAVTQDIINLQAGNYSVIVTDSFLCTDTTLFTITEPAVLLDSINTSPTTCGLNNGSATVFPFGGTQPYSYLWSNGQLTQTASNLPPGIVVVTITDDNQCVKKDSIVVSSIPAQVIATDSVNSVSCFGLSDGAVYITVSGGTPPYTYIWSNTAVTQDVTGLIAGNYTVTVTDNNSCSVIQSFTVTEPVQLADSIQVSNSTCGLANGSATIFPYGGTGPYTYLWNTGATSASISGLVSTLYTVTVTDTNGCSLIETIGVGDVGGPAILLDSIVDATCNTGNDGAIYITVNSGLPPFNYMWSTLATTPDLIGVAGGVYTITVTDQNNCQQSQTYTINAPAALQDSVVLSPSSCGSANGSIAVFAYGGIAPYTYLWSTGSVNDTITGLAAGSYTVTITDANACTITSQHILNNLSGPAITLDSVVQVTCAGDSTGAVYITVANGATPYEYEWSNFATTEDIVNVIAGTYTVTVTDQNNCTATISNVISEPPPVDVIFASTPANCNVANGSITIFVTGGVPGYILLWNNGDTTNTISNLAAGVYTLTVTDANNCVNIFNNSVTNISAPEISIVDSGNVSCTGANDGFIIVSVSGGALPYNYDWSNTTQTGDTLTALVGNITYTLTITDSLGCIAILPVLITEPASFTINSIIPQLNDTFNLSCFGSNDGSIRLNVTGGTEPYAFLWSNFATSDSIGGLSAGNYTVTITDANGCSASQSFIVTQPPLLVSNAGPNKVICGFNSDTLSAVPPVFGTGYWLVVSGSGTFADSTSPTTIVTNLTNGVNVYQWVVTDGVCSAFSQVVITFSTQINAIAGANKEVCENTALLTATAPQFGFGYWRLVDGQGTISDTSKAVTSVTGLNLGPNVFRWYVLNGTCSDSADVTIYVDPSECIEDLELPTGFTPNGDGKNDYFFIKGLDDYPENTIVVYNRWGNKVFEKAGYNNDWSGTNNSGDPLADGTYFVIFKVRSIDRIITTYVDLRR